MYDNNLNNQNLSDVIEWNPTRPDDPNPLDEYLARVVMGLVPCPNWNYMNFGSAGGAALMKACVHKDGECYPSICTGNVHGKIGGCPQYSTNIYATQALIDRIVSLGTDVRVTFGRNGVTAECGNAVKSAQTASWAISEAIVDMWKDRHEAV
jgi:hypothetical protein